MWASIAAVVACGVSLVQSLVCLRGGSASAGLANAVMVELTVSLGVLAVSISIEALARMFLRHSDVDVSLP